jgi:DNA-binding response OmpR family regulator
MARRKPEPSRTERPRVLIVSGNRTERMRLASRIAERDCGCIADCSLADSAKAAIAALDIQPYDIAIIRCDLPDGSGVELARNLAKRGGPAPILLAENPTLEQAVQAMRSGALDIVSTGITASALGASMRAALERAKNVREREARIERLTRVCRRLNQARRDVTKQVSSLCGDMVNAYQELSGQVLQIGIAGEFGSLIRQELDVESLLRTTLEFVLAKVGPTNAAVFLPASSGDFSLGAYVNYDCPKDTADVLLDHLAAIIAPRMEHQPDLKSLTTPEQLGAFLGDDAHWLADSGVILFSCHHEGECLAVVALFRDRRTPFADKLLPTLTIIRDLFGKQLARVIHIHHRHLPKDQWGSFDQGDDDIDLAA